MAKLITTSKAKATKKMAVISKTKEAKPLVLTAESFIKKLKALRSASEQKKIRRYFKSGEGQYGQGDKFIGVPMGKVFALAIEHGEMPLEEIEKLLESDIHEARAGAVSIMDKASRNKKITPGRLKDFYTLYMKRHDRINNWDLVDLGCLHMTGSYLFDKPRKVLYKMAVSKNMWERRTAILSTCYFIRQNEVTDTFKIAEILLKDPEDLIHKATGWMLRFAGDKTPSTLFNFLNRHAAIMPRTMLRAAIEKLEPKKKKMYMELKTKK